MELKIYKEISAIPTPYTPNAIYVVRVGTGFSLFVSDATGAAVFELNSKETFETVSKNLRGIDIVASTANSMTYANGVVKTITRPSANTIVVTLAGTTPAGIELVKTVTTYADKLPTIIYS
ncbi:hypothetical protein [Lacihabitans soyangensis]|uniref:Uncharacterized protein n=1 Tax=Lacihabitans soyangensis TaxID=869394 RepID=A0AAE3H4P4_9BACT|nr:hypothetical protein [Lacihabitans soyangensis]MCP9765154.1 hypothetical protein [Lacihabitans soyangensis]